MKEMFIVRKAEENDAKHSEIICKEITEAAKKRGTGRAGCNPLYIEKKMGEGEAVIAFTTTGQLVGFSYFTKWKDGQVSHSGLIVLDQFRKFGLGKLIKNKIFELSRAKYANAKIFSITTTHAVIEMNNKLGFQEKNDYTELTQDEDFWKGCETCVNHKILMENGRKNCCCKALVFEQAGGSNG